jgi:hypothetical protein
MAEEILSDQGPPQTQSQVYQVAGTGTLAQLRRHPALWPLLIYTMSLLVACLALGALGLVVILKDRDAFAAAAVALPLAYLLVISTGGACYYRFRVPLWPFIAVLVPAGLRLLAERRR